MEYSTTDPRVRRIGDQTWIDELDKFVFEAQTVDGVTGINTFDLRKGPGQQPPLNEKPYDTLDAAIAAIFKKYRQPQP